MQEIGSLCILQGSPLHLIEKILDTGEIFLIVDIEYYSRSLKPVYCVLAGTTNMLINGHYFDQQRIVVISNTQN